MLKAPVLAFSDDIPRAQFWFAYDRAVWKPKAGEPVRGKVFRVPQEFGWGWAYARCRGELLMSAPVLQPATPLGIKQWLETHPKEAQYLVRK